MQRYTNELNAQMRLTPLLARGFAGYQNPKLLKSESIQDLCYHQHIVPALKVCRISHSDIGLRS
jgi:hypothetical protein